MPPQLSHPPLPTLVSGDTDISLCMAGGSRPRVSAALLSADLFSRWSSSPAVLHSTTAFSRIDRISARQERARVRRASTTCRAACGAASQLLVLLNPLFVSRTQHGSGKPLPRPCALNVRCRGALRAERRWGRCLRGWERCDLFHHHPLGWWRHGPRLKWEKAAWWRQHGWPRSGASYGAPRRPQTSNSPPSSRPPFTC